MAEYHAPKFQEEYSAKLPALTLLTSLGWPLFVRKLVLNEVKV